MKQRRYLQIMWPMRVQYSKYTQQLLNSISKHKKYNKKKGGRRPKQTFLQTSCIGGQQAYAKRLNITNYQRDADYIQVPLSQNYNQVPPPTDQKSLYHNVYK